jgi:tRNA/tmRNA/rRNA uracil-C5-methylase (TrmA/RlmC/RlmD family)
VIFSAGDIGQGATTKYTKHTKENAFHSVLFVCLVCFVVKKKKFNDHPFPYRTEIELEISTLTNLGVGLGRVALSGGRKTEGGGPRSTDGESDKAGLPRRSSAERSEGGWVVMVPFTLPGEKVRARVYRNHKNYSEADLLEVLTPSPHRIDPKCPLFGTCGGCQYQHLTYAEQLKWKRQQVEELLKYMAGVEFAVNSVIGSPREFGYRSKITPHFKARHGGPSSSWAAAGTAQQELSPPRVEHPIGFLKQGTRFDLVDVPACPIATPEINAKLPEVRARTHARLAAGEYKRDATLLLRHAQEGVITDYDAVIHEKVGDLRLHFLARDFFQNNPFILPAFTGYVREQAAASGARFLVDAYCGSGLFALSCAPAFEKVAGVEISETSVKFATENAAANGIANATFRAGDAAQIFAGLDFPPTDTAVVIDPPRKGCDESFLNQLFTFGPRAVVYVSCDPATQMRDLKGFLAAGYRLTAVQPFDLFPQTRHLECVITLVRG